MLVDLLKVLVYLFIFEIVYFDSDLYGCYFLFLYLGMIEDFVMGIVFGVMGVYMK